MTLTLTHFYHITICFANPVYQLNPEGTHDFSIILVLIMFLDRKHAIEFWATLQTSSTFCSEEAFKSH